MKVKGGLFATDPKAARFAVVDDLLSRLTSLGRVEWAAILIAILALAAAMFIYLERP